MASSHSEVPTQTVGIDVSDRFTSFWLLDSQGDVVEEGKVRTKRYDEHELEHRGRFLAGSAHALGNDSEEMYWRRQSADLGRVNVDKRSVPGRSARPRRQEHG